MYIYCVSELGLSLADLARFYTVFYRIFVRLHLYPAIEMWSVPRASPSKSEAVLFIAVISLK